MVPHDTVARVARQGWGRAWAWVAALALAALAASVAFEAPALCAVPRREQAAIDQANKGIKLLQEGRWEDAIRELDAALPLAVDAGSVTLIASCHRAIAKAHDALGHVDTALRHYRAYLDANLDEALRRKEVEDRIAALEQLSRAELEVVVDVPGATVLVDGAPSAGPGPRTLAAGVHELRVEAAGYDPHEERLALRGGQRMQVIVRLRPVGPGVPPVVPPEPRAGFGPWPWIAAGVGAVALGVGAWLVADGSADWAEVEAARDDDPPTLTRADADALVADGRTKRTAGFTAVGVGAGLVVTGVVLLFFDDAPTLEATLGPGRGGLALTTSF